MGDVYRRTGRGGAGNFYSQQDLEAATKPKPEQDLEAQPANLPADVPPTDPGDAPPTTTTTSSPPPRGGGGYASTGRGGAGNLTAAPATTTSLFSTTTSSSSAPLAPSSRASGRGGAGNFTSTTDAEEEEDAMAAARRDADMARAVAARLPAAPAPIHRAPGRRRSQNGEEEAEPGGRA
ncbi:hypothetical protein F4780DRAFT_775677 [Xylariomycetidae sp. FL0641]|nr:hypothetical protein F4780DRAFT_775677 [Xylariomycetidae sp. FL0641]